MSNNTQEIPYSAEIKNCELYVTLYVNGQKIETKVSKEELKAKLELLNEVNLDYGYLPLIIGNNYYEIKVTKSQLEKWLNEIEKCERERKTSTRTLPNTKHITSQLNQPTRQVTSNTLNQSTKQITQQTTSNPFRLNIRIPQRFPIGKTTPLNKSTRQTTFNLFKRKGRILKPKTIPTTKTLSRPKTPMEIIEEDVPNPEFIIPKEEPVPKEESIPVNTILKKELGGGFIPPRIPKIRKIKEEKVIPIPEKEIVKEVQPIPEKITKEVVKEVQPIPEYHEYVQQVQPIPEYHYKEIRPVLIKNRIPYPVFTPVKRPVNITEKGLVVNNEMVPRIIDTSYNYKDEGEITVISPSSRLVIKSKPTSQQSVSSVSILPLYANVPEQIREFFLYTPEMTRLKNLLSKCKH